MAKGGIPVVLVENGPPAVVAKLGIPITIVGGSGGMAVVSEGNSAPITGPDGSSTLATGVVHLVDGKFGEVALPAGSTVITDQAGAIPVQDADGTRVNASATIVSGSGQLSYVGLPGTAAIVTDGMSVKMANSDGSGPVDGLTAITGGFINWVKLANATDAIISNGFSTDLGAIAVSPSDDFATVNVASGGLQSVGVSLAPTKAIITSGQQITGVAPTGTYTNTVTITVANGLVTGITLS